jgi:hypothetical protein
MTQTTTTDTLPAAEAAPSTAPDKTADGVEIVYRKVYPNGSVLESFGGAGE